MLFRRVVPYHCLGSIWSQRDKKENKNLAPTVRATITQFNAVTKCVISTILGTRELKIQQRAKIIEKWIHIAHVKHLFCLMFFGWVPWGEGVGSGEGGCTHWSQAILALILSGFNWFFLWYQMKLPFLYSILPHGNGVDTCQSFREVQIADISSSSLVHWWNPSIVGGHWPGQARLHQHVESPPCLPCASAELPRGSCGRFHVFIMFFLIFARRFFFCACFTYL